MCEAVCQGSGSEGLELTRKVFKILGKGVEEQWDQDDITATAWTTIEQERKGKGYAFKTPAKAGSIQGITEMLADTDLNDSATISSPMSLRGVGAKLIGANLVEQELEDEDFEDLEDENMGKQLYKLASMVETYFHSTGESLNALEASTKSVSDRLSHLAVTIDERFSSDTGLEGKDGSFPDVWTAIGSQLDDLRDLKNKITENTSRLDLGELGVLSPQSLRIIHNLLPDPSNM